MARTVHIIGNGDQAVRYKPQKGTKITCNLPPFSVEGVYATCLVDFKIMHAMHMGEIAIPGDWILGFRPHKYLEMNPDLRIRWGSQIRDYFTEKPPYAPTLTDWNCGHMATAFSALLCSSDLIRLCVVMVFCATEYSFRPSNALVCS